LVLFALDFVNELIEGVRVRQGLLESCPKVAQLLLPEGAVHHCLEEDLVLLASNAFFVDGRQ
jgi:hypothetical protein